MTAVMTMQTRYANALQQGKLLPDPAQARTVEALDRFLLRLLQPEKRKFFFRTRKNSATKGLYLYGAVGRGKTMLMDWLLQALHEKNIAAERWHFHAFMLEIHANLRDLKAHSPDLENRVQSLADRWAERLRVLCFDEFHVTDVADAMIMMPLFTRLFARGVTVVATSNWKPEDLYQGGLQRQRFLPFIETLKRHMEILPMDGGQDYRLVKERTLSAWLSPLNEETAERFDTLFRDAVGYDSVETHEMHIGSKDAGRSWVIPRASKTTAWLDMAHLLDQPLGASDFLALTKRYRLLFLDRLTPFSIEESDKAKRFMVMIDTLYDGGVRLAIRAAGSPEALYPVSGRLAAEFRRTVSRLKEMTIHQ
jgi:cell division protein ZapE